MTDNEGNNFQQNSSIQTKEIKRSLIKKILDSKDIRYKRSIFTSLTGALLKFISFVVNLAIVRMTFNYLGPERYGLWMTITSFVFLGGFADLGIGNGLTNSVAACFGRDDNSQMRRNISSAFFILFFISFLLIIAVTVISSISDFSWLLPHNQHDMTMETKWSVFFMAVIFSLNIFLGTAQRVQTGLQEGYKTNIFQGLGLILSLAFTDLAINMHLSLPAIVLAFSSGQLIAAIANNYHLYFVDRPKLAPVFKLFDKSSAEQILRSGFYFFLLQVVVAFAFTVDNLIISKKFSFNEVSYYSIAQRLFILGPTLQTLIVAPLWPAYGEAKVKNDHKWIKKTFWRSLWLSIGICAVSSTVIYFGSKIITKFWLGKEVDLPYEMLLGFVIWSILSAYLSAVSTMLNGLHILKYQTIWMLLFGLISILLKIYLPISFGVASVIWTTVICFIIFYGIPSMKLLMTLETGGLEKIK